MSAMRMQHYAAFLQSFDYKIRHRRSSDPEREIEEPDAVEVNMIQTLPLTVDELGTETLFDNTVKVLLNGLKAGRIVEPKFRFGVGQEEFSLQKDCLMSGIRVYLCSTVSTF